MSDPIIYLDSSAIVKLVFDEPESDDLLSFLADRPSLVSSTVARLEVLRIAARVQDPMATREANRIVRGINLVRLDERVLVAASQLEPAVLRTLDAIHLATAQSIGHQLAGMVVYDRRLSAAARQHGIETFAPGH